MFCKNCGTEINDTMRFCHKCGYDRTCEMKQNKKLENEDNQIIYKIKPSFKITYKICTTMFYAIIYILIIYIACPVLAKWSFTNSIILKITLATIIIYCIIKMMFEKVQYNNLEYNFYKTKIEYKDNFLHREEKQLKYAYIKEIIMKQNILERMCNIGTIRIYTNATNVDSVAIKNGGIVRKNGICIHCVKNVQEQYKIVKKIIDEGTQQD